MECRKRLVTRPIAVGLAGLLGAPALSQASPCTCVRASAVAGEASDETLRQSVLASINHERGHHRQRSLRSSPVLAQAAAAHARDMARRRYFDHTFWNGETFIDRIKGAGYLDGDETRWTLGENLAWGSGEQSSPNRIVSAWMASPAHREVLPSSHYREVGIEVSDATPVQTSLRGTTYAADFGWSMTATRTGCARAPVGRGLFQGWHIRSTLLPPNRS